MFSIEPSRRSANGAGGEAGSEMSEVVLQQAAAQSAVADRSRALGRMALVDRIFREATRAAAVIVLVILGGVIVSLVYGSWPAIRAFGFGFFVSQSWNPVTENFGALAGDLRHDHDLDSSPC